MFNHVMIGTNDLQRAQAFYDALLGTLGVEGPPARSVANSGHVRLFYRHAGNTLGITQPIDGRAASSCNGSTIAFRCDSPEQVRRFHDAAVAQGGMSIEDPPGLRTLGTFTYYLAYVRDLDGHKLCAIHRVPG